MTVSGNGVNPGGVLEKIVATKRLEVAAAKDAAPLATWEDELPSLPPTRDFKRALMRGGTGPARVIAEVKKASPSKGLIRADFDPVRIATAYRDGGASCISVLTDVEYFQGSADYLRAVRQAVDLPLLRKDFTIDAYQIFEARRWGADAVLLIAAILTDAQLKGFAAVAHSLGLAALVEVHTAAERDRAVAAGADLIGINNRDLNRFETSLDTTHRLLEGIPESCVRVSESGIFTREQVAELEAAGVDAILVGESLMRQDDMAAGVRALTGAAGG
ncbi:MAG: indole-3-glycerol phosphate synthase TrpC [Nitrospirota bacterium]|nr:indole-3-glycerol phosphate synthase TrpC [Nitrospirota bacterium]